MEDISDVLHHVSKSVNTAWGTIIQLPNCCCIVSIAVIPCWELSVAQGVSLSSTSELRLAGI